MSNKYYLLSLALLLLFATQARALTFDLGVNISQPSLLVHSATQDTALAEMVDNISVWPTISFKLKERYFGKSNFGYAAEMMAWYMKLDNQKVGGRAVNLGTSAKGYYAHFTPTLYYRFGDRYSMSSPNWMTTIGIGIGIGYLNVRGTMITTGITPQRLDRIDGVRFGLSSGVFIEVMKNKWFVRLTSFGPIIEKGAFKMELRDNSLVIGRRFAIDLF